MGTCISKCSCRPSSRVQEPPAAAVPIIQDKLVIVSHTPSSPLPKKCFASSPVKPPPSPSVSSTPSTTTTTATTTITYSSDFSISSIASSCDESSYNKERSFSNEFLLSCIKEHPHIIHLKPVKPTSSDKPPPPKSTPAAPPQQRRPSPPPRARSPQTPRRAGARSPLRAVSTNSSSSPASEKSFSKERRGPNSGSRRLDGNAHSISDTASRRRVRCPSSNSIMKENTMLGGGSRTSSPWRAGNREEAAYFHSGQKQIRDKNVTRMKTNVHQIDDQNVEWKKASCDTDLQRECGSSTPREDIDNPLIALDCFIFL